MTKLIIQIDDSGIANRQEAEEFATEIGADSFSYTNNRISKQSSIDLGFENHYDGNTILEYYGDNAQGYLEFEDGTVSKHFVRRERRFDD